MAGSTVTATQKKTAKSKSPNGSATGFDFDKIRLRLFDPEREKVEWQIDKVILQKIEDYEKYLTEKYGQKPARNKVVELLLDDILRSNSDFQNWCKTGAGRNGNGTSHKPTEADEILET